MAANDWAALAAAGFTRGELMAAAELRTPYVLGPAEDVQTIALGTARAVVREGVLYRYDAGDVSSAHDGVAVLVDSAGRRYKADAQPLPRSVLDRLGVPPGSPAYGDAYLVTAGASGAWAGQDDAIALWTARGWLFVQPVIGAAVLVEDEAGFWHYTAAGAWAAGLGALTVAAGTVDPLRLTFPAGIAVEAQQNAPPGSPVNGLAWLVGTAGSGDWTGRNAQIAVRLAGAWSYVAPYEGARVYDKATNQLLTYQGSWLGPADAKSVEKVVAVTLGSPTTSDFTGLGAFRTLRLMIIADVGTAGLEWSLRTSADDGSTYAATPGDYITDLSITETHLLRGALGPSDARRVWAVQIDAFNDPTCRTVAGYGGTGHGARRVAEANNALRLVWNAPPTGVIVQIDGMRA